MTSVRTILADNLALVQRRIAEACARAGRERSDVTLIAVTKTVSAEVAAHLVDLGIRDLGENRPQELWRKAALLPRDVRWHLIGHLQRNKIERTLPLIHRLHSVDSLRLLEALDISDVEVMLEFNCSGEASKQGFATGDVPAIVEALGKLRRVRVVGLMTMAALEPDPERCRPTFALLRQLREELKQQVSDRHSLTELSMGMSNDFEVAIEEGATAVRLGTVLFGEERTP